MRLNKRHFENDISFVPLGVFQATEFIEQILILVIAIENVTVLLLKELSHRCFHILPIKLCPLCDSLTFSSDFDDVSRNSFLFYTLQ